MEKDSKLSRNIKNLYLDPNNYRFIDNPKYTKVPNNEILDEKVQQRTRNFIEGIKRENIRDLIASFKTNGFLEVDKIQVKELSPNQFLVLEGNRRIVTLQALFDDYQSGYSIGKLDPAIFKSIPFEIHDKEDEFTHMLVMGLKHISGNKKWPAINQAQYISDLLKQYDNRHIGEESACEALGITKHKLRQSQRALSLIESYKKSDYGDQFKNNMYSIFEEIVKRPVLKSWLDWNDDTYISRDQYNEERLFSWISEVDKTEYYEDENGEYEGETQTRYPIIERSLEIRTLAEFIYDEKAIEVMIEKGNVSVGLAVSEYAGKSKFGEALKSAQYDIDNAQSFKEYIEDEDLQKIEDIQNKIASLLPKKATLSLERDKSPNAYFELQTQKHFSEITIENHKVFKNFTINGLRKVNIIAGLNNTGKTSLLEAIYFLTIQNDMSAFIEIIKLKNKFKELDPVWFIEALNEKIVVKGNFNDLLSEVQINNYETTEDINKAKYLTTYQIDSTVGSEKNSSKMHIYSHSEPQLHFKDVKHLCYSMFKSPYFYDHADLLNSYTSTIEQKTHDEIIQFIQKIDSSIEKIELVEKYGIKRFLVTSSRFENARDISTYGEGLQRVYEISLSFAYAKNGVILIDELETAIHKELLIDFTKFIQVLADKFNVQVFLTSHSKECIDAFVKNDYGNSDVMAYQLENENGQLTYQYIDGEKLDRLVENMDIDIRGTKHEN